MFNTNQGSQFTSQEFTQVLQDRGVKISMDGKGRYADNIFVERLWRTVKYEEVYLKAYASAGEARRELGAYFRFYNDQRPHQALGYRTPGEVFSEGQAPQNEESTVGRWSPEADVVYVMRKRRDPHLIPPLFCPTNRVHRIATAIAPFSALVVRTGSCVDVQVIRSPKTGPPGVLVLWDDDTYSRRIIP